MTADLFEGCTIGAVGVGNMGGAIIRGVLQARLLTADRFIVADLDTAKADALRREYGIGVAADLADLAGRADLLLLAVKPQGAKTVLHTLAPAVNIERHCIVSIMAGVPASALAGALPAGARIVRVMPNTPCLVGAGMTAVSPATTATATDTDRVRALFATLGKVVAVEERHMDAVTAVSGSGPAYLFYVAECLEAAALAEGLPADVARTLVTQTLLGAATLLDGSPESAATLRERVTSPGGTTEAALDELRRRHVADAWRAAVAAAARRGAELAALA